MATWKKTVKWSGISLLVLLALLAFAIALVANFDWNRAKPWISERVSTTTGRSFAINGDLSVEWRTPPASVSGWQRWVPWPHIRARDIVLGNPDWVDATPTMARVRDLSATVVPLPLLRNELWIPQLQIDMPRVHLERSKEGENNWTFGKKDDPSQWKWRVDRLHVTNGSLRLVDAVRDAKIRAQIDTEADDSIVWKLTGTLAGDEVSGDGRAGRILSLQQEDTRYPIEGKLQAGKTRIAVQGTLTNPQALAALDLELKLSGLSMAHLHRITGIVLPDTFPYFTEGRLRGTFGSDGKWRYDDFKGKVGSSDIAGTLEYVRREPRPLLTGRVTSTVLRFDDLAPLVGADSNANKIRRGAKPVQPRAKALPVEKFGSNIWTSIDADVHFNGKRIIRKKDLPIDNLATHIKLQDGVLTLEPLSFGMAGGKLNAHVTLDGRGEKIKAEMKVSARHLQLKRLFPGFDPMKASLGQINGDAALSATGDSIAELLGSSNGEIKALIDRGTISKLLLETMGLNIGNIVLTTIFGDRQIELNCLASDFTVKDGVMSTRMFIMDTDDAVVHASGRVNLAQENLNLTLKPESKGVRVISLRSPLYVTGSFKNPNVEVDKGVLALKAGSALALGALAPAAAALLPLVNMGPGEKSPCAALLAQVKKKPVAPPPKPAGK